MKAGEAEYHFKVAQGTFIIHRTYHSPEYPGDRGRTVWLLSFAFCDKKGQCYSKLLSDETTALAASRAAAWWHAAWNEGLQCHKGPGYWKPPEGSTP